MFTNKISIITLLALLLVSPVVLQAATITTNDPNEHVNPNVEDYVWKEGGALIPDYPLDENLQEFSVDNDDGRFHYFLDSKSLQFGDDGIIRYTVVIRTNKGVSSVAFEGMNCSEGEYKLYAFGDGRGKFRPVREPQWKPLEKTRHTRYRRELSTRYLCAPERISRSTDIIINAMKYNWNLSGGEGFR